MIKKYTYKGNLDLYFETGMEQQVPILCDLRGYYKSPSFNNETKKWDGPQEEFRKITWCVWIRGEEYLKVFDKDNNLVWEGLITKDREKIKELKYALSFIPKEIELEKWLLWCTTKYLAEVSTNTPVTAEKKEEEVPHEF